MQCKVNVAREVSLLALLMHSGRIRRGRIFFSISQEQVGAWMQYFLFEKHLSLKMNMTPWFFTVQGAFLAIFQMQYVGITTTIGNLLQMHCNLLLPTTTQKLNKRRFLGGDSLILNLNNAENISNTSASGHRSFQRQSDYIWQEFITGIFPVK